MKAAIYCRLSEEDRNKQFETDDSNSIRNQKSMLLQYAAAQGWEVYQIYSDDDYAGADRNRPEFNRLLADAQNHRFDIVLCKTQSRFTRELELVEKYLHGLFPAWGIRFVSIVDNADTANKGNKKARQINGLVNEWYLEDMSENIRSVLTSRRMNGFHIGSFALYGYRKDPEQKGRLLIDEEAAAVVREVFTLFAQGWGKTAIAQHLNDRGIPNPTEYKRLHGLRYQQPKMRNSTLWKYFAIADMLQNEIYIGNMVQGRYGSVSYKTKRNRPRPRDDWYIVQGTHEAIISRELWDRVQAQIAQRARPFRTGEVGLFARKARCAGCGYVMRSTKSRGVHYLMCSSRHVSKDACPGAFLSVDSLEQAVLAELKRLSEELLDRDRLEGSIQCRTDWVGRRNRIKQELPLHERRIAEYERGIRELYLDKVKGIVSETGFIELSKHFHSEKERLEGIVRDSRRQLAALQEKIDSGGNKGERIGEYIPPTRLTRELVEAFLDFVVVGRRLPGTGDVPVELHWSF